MGKKRQNILLINSNSAERQHLRQYLNSSEMNFIEASSGVEAANLLQAEQIALVITEIAIEPFDGWKLIRMIRSGICRTRADVPIILVTRNWCDQLTRLTARDFGINQLISFDNLEQLSACVRTCLDPKQKPLKQKRLLIVSEELNQDYDDALAVVYAVDRIADVSDGFSFWQQEQHDLVLIDNGLGGETGLDLLKKIVGRNPDQPVIMAVADHEKMNAPQLMLCGAADIILKPYQVVDLIQVAALVLRRTEYLLCQSQCSLRTESLQQLQQLFQHVIRSMPSVLIGVDQQMRVIIWNQEAEKVSTVPAENALGLLLSDVWPQLTCLERVEQALADREIKKLTDVCWSEGPAQRYVDMTIYPLLDSSVVGAVIRIDDVTGRVLLEKRIIQSEKMVSMGHLAAGLAHEINNPLAGILQNVQVVRNRLAIHPQANKSAAEQAGLNLNALGDYIELREIDNRLDAVMDSGGQAAKMVENMLSFSRNDDTSSLPENMSDLIDRSVELAASNFNLKQKFDFRLIQIRRDYDHSTPLIKCNRIQMQQVFINLLMNGAFFMDIKRQEMKRQGMDYRPCFDLRIKNEIDHVRLEVEDNGPGIDAANQKHIFDPFYTASRKSKGAGLGLAICYFIVCEHHHGSLSVNSIPNKRTRFSITLPK